MADYNSAYTGAQVDAAVAKSQGIPAAAAITEAVEPAAASAGDVWTADGQGGAAWAAPSGGGSQLYQHDIFISKLSGNMCRIWASIINNSPSPLSTTSALRTWLLNNGYTSSEIVATGYFKSSNVYRIVTGILAFVGDSDDYIRVSCLEYSASSIGFDVSKSLDLDISITDHVRAL